MNKKIMMDYVYEQLSIDYNCEPDDFLKDGLIFTPAKELDGRRPFPWVTPRLELISMGNSVVVNASEELLPHVRKQLMNKSRDEAFWMPFVYGVMPYFLPDLERIPKLNMPEGLECVILENEQIHSLYKEAGFNYVLQYDINSPFKEMIVVLARDKDKVVGMAGANADCKHLREINVDVLPPYRGKGLASALVNRLTIELLNREYVPYYFTSDSNVFSMRAAMRAGYAPAWVHCYKTRLDLLPRS